MRTSQHKSCKKWGERVAEIRDGYFSFLLPTTLTLSVLSSCAGLYVGRGLEAVTSRVPSGSVI